MQVCFLMLGDKEPFGVGLFWCFPSPAGCKERQRKLEHSTVEDGEKELNRTGRGRLG